MENPDFSREFFKCDCKGIEKVKKRCKNWDKRLCKLDVSDYKITRNREIKKIFGVFEEGLDRFKG